ncbi:MAG TPA: hypothetical protein DHV62_05525, partial [Elusimicrobia bacterium]|nr:hypothetical protein [Elusimicrobiota bacterium]
MVSNQQKTVVAQFIERCFSKKEKKSWFHLTPYLPRRQAGQTVFNHFFSVIARSKVTRQSHKRFLATLGMTLCVSFAFLIFNFSAVPPVNSAEVGFTFKAAPTPPGPLTLTLDDYVNAYDFDTDAPVQWGAGADLAFTAAFSPNYKDLEAIATIKDEGPTTLDQVTTFDHTGVTDGHLTPMVGRVYTILTTGNKAVAIEVTAVSDTEITFTYKYDYTPVSPPSTTGSISGTVTYEGTTSSGTFYVWVSTEGAYGEPAIGPDGQWVITTVNVPGQYNLTVQGGWNYWIMSARDFHSPYLETAGPTEYPFENDPKGIYSPDSISVGSGDNLTTKDITLQDAPPPPPTGSISGTVSYSGEKGGLLAVALLKSFDGEEGAPELLSTMTVQGPFIDTGAIPYSFDNLQVGDTWYFLSILFTSAFDDVQKIDPWYFHGTFDPSLTPTPIIVPATFDFTLVEATEENPNPFYGMKGEEGYRPNANSYHSKSIQDQTEIHYYSINLGIWDSNKTATSVTVSGPGIGNETTDIINLLSEGRTEGNQWGNWYSTATRVEWKTPDSPPSPPLYYTFNITDSSGTQVIIATMTAFIEQFVTDLQPAENENWTSDTLNFSWTGLGTGYKYRLSLTDKGETGNDWNTIWYKEDITATDYIYDGTTALVEGHYYEYSIQANDPNWNCSQINVRFKYKFSAPPPTTGSISGTVTNNSGQTGPIWVTCWKENGQDIWVQASLSEPYTYTIPDLSSGTYSVAALVDSLEPVFSDTHRELDPGEPWAA